jgi:hypothetical protein
MSLTELTDDALGRLVGVNPHAIADQLHAVRARGHIAAIELP